MGVLLVAGLAFGGKPKLPEYASLKKVKTVSLAKGGVGAAKLEISVVKGFHVQSNPASLPNLIPTTLILEKLDGVTVEAPVYPVGKPHKLQGTPGEVMAYDETFEIKVPLSASSEAKVGKQTLMGKLRYQACNEKTCFFPMTLPVAIPISIQKAIVTTGSQGGPK